MNALRDMHTCNFASWTSSILSKVIQARDLKPAKLERQAGHQIGRQVGCQGVVSCTTCHPNWIFGFQLELQLPKLVLKLQLKLEPR